MEEGQRGASVPVLVNSISPVGGGEQKWPFHRELKIYQGSLRDGARFREAGLAC